MIFDPKYLPPTVKKFYNQGKLAWTATVQAAIEVGIDDLNVLTDMVFYLHHPEKLGNQIKSHEVDLIEQWENFKFLIRLMDSSKEFHKKLKDTPKPKNNHTDWIIIDSMSSPIFPSIPEG